MIVPPDSLELLNLVFSRPKQAVEGARAILAANPSSFDASVAYHTIGLAHREYGDLAAAISELRRALALARRADSAARIADVLATLGIALVHSGRSARGLALLDEGVLRTNGVLGAQVRFRRGGALWILGRHAEALADVRTAIPVLRKAKDTVWVARALTLRGLIHLALGSVRRADTDLADAQQLFAGTDELHASAFALHNRGLVAFRSGDIPGALSCLDEVGRRYRSLGTPTPELIVDRCAVLLSAGLAPDALAEADTGIDALTQLRGQATRRAELLLIAARAALAAGLLDAADERATAAATVFAAQHRTWWHAHARLLLVQIRFAADPAAGRLLAQANTVTTRLAALGSPELTDAHLLAGRVALATGRTDQGIRHLADAAVARHRGPAISRVDGWLAKALLARANDDRRGMLAACRHGLDVLDEHRLTLGASELRARATARGAELAELAQRACARSGHTRELLRWSERWRATVCAVAPTRPPDDHGVRGELAALREVTSRLQRAFEQGAPTHGLDTERLRLERLVRTRTLHAPGSFHGRLAGLDINALLDRLGNDRLLEIVDIDGQLHVLVCGAGRVRLLRAGPFAAAGNAIESARFTLRRLAHRRIAGHDEKLLAHLGWLGRRLEQVLLGETVRHLGDGPVVIVPPGRLHGVPWALLPALAGRAHAVAPSASAWLTSRTAARPTRSDVVLIRGPGLATFGAEVAALTGLYPGARLLRDESATATRVLDELDGASLAHIAAHGTFRADNPLFSSMRLADGALTVYDLERLRRAPYRIVLPSCDSGRLQPVGADELLGLTTALLPLGTAGIVASLVPVDDQATATLMLALHKALGGTTSLADALHTARQAMPDDPVHHATALSFVALGAA